MAEKVVSNSRLLQHLVQLGLVKETDLRTASARQKEQGGDILDVLVEAGLVREHELAGALASFYRVPQVNLTRVRVTKQALRQATGEFSRHHQVLPFGIDHQSGELMVAISNPAQVSAIDALRFRNGQNIRAYVAPRTQLKEAIEFYYFTDHSDSRPITGPQRSGLAARPKSTRSRTGMLKRPVTDGRLGTSSEPSEHDSRNFGRPVSREYYEQPDEEPSYKSLSPGTEELGVASLASESSGELFGPPRASVARARRPRTGADLRADSAISGIGNLNPFAAQPSVKARGGVDSQVTRLEETVARLEKALRHEMAVSQALAEILVENGLVSSEQLKSRLRD